MSAQIKELRVAMERELGGITSMVNRTFGPLLLWSARRQARLYPCG